MLFACGGSTPPITGPACAGPANAPWSVPPFLWAGARVARDPLGGTVVLSNGTHGATMAKLDDQGHMLWVSPDIPGYARAVAAAGSDLAVGVTSVTGPTGLQQVKLTPFNRFPSSDLADEAANLDARFVILKTDGGTIVGGVATAKAEPGAGPSPRGGGFLAEVLPEGTPLWLRRFGDPGALIGFAASGGAVGALVWTPQAIMIDEVALQPRQAPGSAFFVTFDIAGNASAAIDVTEDSRQTFESVAVDGGGRVYVSGVAPGDAAGQDGTTASELFVAAFERSGEHVWTQRFAVGDRAEGSRIALDECGDVLLIGNGVGKTDGYLVARLGRDGEVVARVDVRSSKRRVAQDLAPAPGGAVVVGAEGDGQPDAFGGLVRF